MLYVSGATCVGGEKYQCEWKVLKAGLQEAKYRIFDCNNLCCVVCFWFLRIIVCEMNAQVNQTTVLLFFCCTRSLVSLLGGSMNMQITKAHER